MSTKKGKYPKRTSGRRKRPAKRGTHFEYNGLVVFAQVECKDVGVHERLSALTENVDGFLEKLDFNPRHVVQLHLLHPLLHGGVQLCPKCTHKSLTLIPAEVRSPAPTPVGTGEARALHHFYKWLGMGGTVSRKTANQTVQTITKALTKTTNCNCIAEKSGAARLNFFNVCPPPLSNVLQRHWLWRYIMPGAQEAFINTVKGKNQVI